MVKGMAGVTRKITDRRMIGVLFGLCWIVYFATYIGRLNYSSAMTDMIAREVLTKSEAGTISMVFFFCYGGGQLINGFLGDRISPKRMIFIGLFASALLNACMGLVSYFPVMALLWGLNGYVQSMIWPPIVHIFAEMLEGDSMIRCSIHITSTIAVGTLGSYLLSAGMIELAGWKMVFWAASVVLAVIAIVWYVGFSKVERFAAEFGTVTESPVSSTIANPTANGYPQISLWKLVTSGGLLLILIPVVVHGVLKDGVTSWVPTYISETFSASAVLAILVTTVLPVVNLVGAYAANFMNQKFFRNESRTSAFFFLIALAALVLLRVCGSFHIVLSVCLLAVITSSMLAVNTMLINIVPLYFGKVGKSSTVSGFLNCTSYLGAAISTFTIGVMVEKAGWDFTIFSWVILAALAFILCFAARKNSFSPDNCMKKQ